MKTNCQALRVSAPTLRRPFSFVMRVMIGLWLAMVLSQQQAVAQLAPQGQARIAYQFQGDPITTHSRDFVDVPGLALFVTVPDGKVADVLILFSALMNTGDALYVQALVDGIAARPGSVLVLSKTSTGIAQSQGYNFSSFVSSGSHIVKMQWAGLGDQQYMLQRSMALILNVRDP
jgi:hypothetical protein